MRATIQEVEVKDFPTASERLPDIPLLVGDERRIKQVLINLMRNAIKFTQSGNIEL